MPDLPPVSASRSFGPANSGDLLARWIGSAAGRAMRDGMLWLVPYLMLWSTLLILLELARHTGHADWTPAWLEHSVSAMRQALPLALWGSIGSAMALHARLPRAGVAFVCLGTGLLMEQWLLASGPAARSLSVPMGIVGPLMLVRLISTLTRLRLGQMLPHSTAAGQQVAEVLNLIFPALGAVTLLMASLWLASRGIALMPLPDGTARLHETPVPVLALLYTLANSLLWSLGVHGYYALIPLLELIPAGPTPGQPLSQSFLGIFVFIGGSGGTASLVLALLLFSRDRKHRIVALASALPALVNVNELLLFGLPLIMNRHLVLPFVLVPVINLGVATAVMHAGWIAPLPLNLPFTGPLFLNALLGSGGQQGAMVLQAVCLVLGTAIYLPFLKRFEARDLQQPLTTPRALETAYIQRREEAHNLLDDPVRTYATALGERRRLGDALRCIDQGEFLLHYQPKVDPHTGRVTSCEALLRLDMGDGQLRMPGSFLPDLERAGQMKAVDLWVLKTALEQLADWQDAGLKDLTLAVNVSVDSLGDPQAVQALCALLAAGPGPIAIELTEQALVGNEAETRNAIAALKAAGAKIQIDDFGTGFSALSYLHRFDIDGIKLDRSFTQALHTERGRCVFSGLAQLAHALDLDLVVEGVERSEQLRLLLQVMAERPLTVQGWIYSRGVAGTAFIEHLRALERGATEFG